MGSPLCKFAASGLSVFFAAGSENRKDGTHFFLIVLSFHSGILKTIANFSLVSR